MSCKMYISRRTCLQVKILSGLMSLILYIFPEICPQNFFPDPEREFPVYRSKITLKKSVPELFVRTSEISGLSEPRLTNHHSIKVRVNVTRSLTLVSFERDSLV